MALFRYILFCILSASAIFAENLCPSWPTDSPCSCYDAKDGLMVRCIGPAQASDVISALDALRRAEGPWNLQMELLDMEELPPIVKMASSLRLSSCNVDRLQRMTPVAWPRLSEVVLESVRIGHNPWSQLKGARALKSVKVSDFPMLRTIGQNFRGVPDSVEYLDLRKTGTTRLEPGCMSHLKNLRYVFIADVPLNDFPRAALPVTLPQLHTFILGNTLIERLEPNFFEGMPKLKVLMLNGNKLTSLDSRLFMPLENHLTHLVAERNPLVCDCRLLWLKRNFQNRGSTNVLATCYDSSTQEFSEVMELNEEDYC